MSFARNFNLVTFLLLCFLSVHKYNQHLFISPPSPHTYISINKNITLVKWRSLFFSYCHSVSEHCFDIEINIILKYCQKQVLIENSFIEINNFFSFNYFIWRKISKMIEQFNFSVPISLPLANNSHDLLCKEHYGSSE